MDLIQRMGEEYCRMVKPYAMEMLEKELMKRGYDVFFSTRHVSKLRPYDLPHLSIRISPTIDDKIPPEAATFRPVLDIIPIVDMAERIGRRWGLEVFQSYNRDISLVTIDYYSPLGIPVQKGMF